MELSLVFTHGGDDGGAFWITLIALPFAALLVLWIAFRLDAIVRWFQDRFD